MWPLAVVELDRIIQKIEQQPPDLPGIKSADHILLHCTGNFDAAFARLRTHAVNRLSAPVQKGLLFHAEV